MLILRGASALSAFRHEKLIRKLASISPTVNAVSAEYVHFAETNRDLSDAELAVLERLLQYGDGLGVAETVQRAAERCPAADDTLRERRRRPRRPRRRRRRAADRRHPRRR